MQQAFQESENDVPFIVDVTIDYTKKTYMTKGVVKVNLARFSFKEKVRFVSKKQTDLDNYLESVFLYNSSVFSIASSKFSQVFSEVKSVVINVLLNLDSNVKYT